MPKSPPVASATARLAVLHRYHSADHPQIYAARRALDVEVLADRIAKVVAADPPLTGDQRTRLTELLAGGAR